MRENTGQWVQLYMLLRRFRNRGGDRRQWQRNEERRWLPGEPVVVRMLP